MNKKYTTLEDFAKDIGILGLSFDDIPSAEDKDMLVGSKFKNGNFKLTLGQEGTAENLAKELMEEAEAQGVVLEQLADIRDVMNYDANATLTAKELGAYLVGMSMTKSLTQEKVDGEIKGEFSVVSSKLNVSLGNQVFGDTNGSADTLRLGSEPQTKDMFDDLMGKGKYEVSSSEISAADTLSPDSTPAPAATSEVENQR